MLPRLVPRASLKSILTLQRFSKMTLKTLGAKKAAELDKDLMSEDGGFSIDQLMELAGLSVSQAVYKVHPPSSGSAILIACGPGNNGGDGLVAARHLFHYGYKPTIYYPKPTKQPIFTGLVKQLHNLSIPFLSTPEDFTSALKSTDLIVDSLFGFSFHPPVRSPFDVVLSSIIDSNKPVLSVDIPSSWDVESGPPEKGQIGDKFMPEYMISLTAAKPCVKWFKGKKHFIGGRFLSQQVADKYGIEVPSYQGLDQVVEIEVVREVEKLQIKPGLYVSIVLKADQRSGRQVQGRVAQTLTRHNHPRGIKVKLTDGRVGRVQQILDENQNNRPRNAMSSNNNPWADSVSQGQSQGYQPQQSQQNSQPPMSYAAYQLAQNAQENPWGGQDQSQGYNNYNPPQQSSFGYNAPQGAPPTQPIRRSDTEQLLAQQTDRAEQVEHMQQYESATPMSEDDRNQADLQRQFPNIDSSLIAAIYNERKPDMAEVRELLQELNTS